jgi:hypothetical protein
MVNAGPGNGADERFRQLSDLCSASFEFEELLLLCVVRVS